MEQWKKNLYILTIVEFIMRMAVQLFVPFLPLYIHDMGVQEVASIAIWAGIITSANQLSCALMSPIWGVLADRHGRRLMVLRSIFSLAFFYLLMSFATSVFQMFILRLLTGVFSGFTAASIAMVGSNTPEEKLGKAMGTLQLGQITGTVVGPLVGGVLCDILSYSAVLMMGSILCLVGGILVYVLLKEEHVKTESKKTNLFKSMKQTFETRALLPMFLVLFLAQFSLKIVEPILSLFVKTLYTNKEYLSTMSGIVFGVTGVSNIIGVFVLGNLSEKIGNRKLLTFSLIGGGISYFLQALASNLTMLIVLRVMLGFFMAGILPSANALVGQLTSREKRGAAYGLTASATFLGGFLGPLSGGFISSAVGLRAVFPITAGLMIFNAFWVVIAKKKSEK